MTAMRMKAFRLMNLTILSMHQRQQRMQHMRYETSLEPPPFFSAALTFLSMYSKTARIIWMMLITSVPSAIEPRWYRKVR